MKPHHVGQFVDNLTRVSGGKEVWVIWDNYRPHGSIAAVFENNCQQVSRRASSHVTASILTVTEPVGEHLGVAQELLRSNQCVFDCLGTTPEDSQGPCPPSSTPSRQTMRVAAGKPSNDEAGFRSRVTTRRAWF
jgi:hypothetical protein